MIQWTTHDQGGGKWGKMCYAQYHRDTDHLGFYGQVHGTQMNPALAYIVAFVMIGL